MTFRDIYLKLTQKGRDKFKKNAREEMLRRLDRWERQEKLPSLTIGDIRKAIEGLSDSDRILVEVDEDFLPRGTRVEESHVHEPERPDVEIPIKVLVLS